MNLIAYYSRKGDNYVSGDIVNLAVGNTEVIAKKIRTLVGGELFHIDTRIAYPEDYTETTKVAKEELRQNARPALAQVMSNLDAYDTILLGYPNWWETMPMAVFTFLEGHDFAGKTIVPFCTHEGSGMGQSESDIKKLCPEATVLTGLAIRGGNVTKAESELLDWLSKHGLLQNPI